VLGWAFGRDPGGIAEVGEPAPDFTVEVISGGEFTLSEQTGHPVVLNLWASWCEPCRIEIPDISVFAEDHPGVVVIGVSVRDDPQSARDFAAEVDAGYPLALGTNEFEDSYPTFGLPATYVLDENGVVTDVFNGIVDENLLAEVVG
jgi:thiol-disulfide isomerase/thioredoxin